MDFKNGYTLAKAITTGQKKAWHLCSKTRLNFEDGYLYLPQEPGLGLIVNEKEMEKRKLN